MVIMMMVIVIVILPVTVQPLAGKGRHPIQRHNPRTCNGRQYRRPGTLATPLRRNGFRHGRDGPPVVVTVVAIRGIGDVDDALGGGGASGALVGTAGVVDIMSSCVDMLVEDLGWSRIWLLVWTTSSNCLLIFSNVSSLPSLSFFSSSTLLPPPLLPIAPLAPSIPPAPPD